MNTKHPVKYRSECLASYIDVIRRAAESLRVYDANGFQESCLSCRHFDEPNEICNTYKARPPARVIALGCPTYEDEREIPF